MRYEQRPRKLTPVEESIIRALAGTNSLRSPAADFGVSHETIRFGIYEGRIRGREYRKLTNPQGAPDSAAYRPELLRLLPAFRLPGPVAVILPEDVPRAGEVRARQHEACRLRDDEALVPPAIPKSDAGQVCCAAHGRLGLGPTSLDLRQSRIDSPKV